VASPPYAPKTSVQMQHSGSALPFILGSVCARGQMLPSASALLEEWGVSRSAMRCWMLSGSELERICSLRPASSSIVLGTWGGLVLVISVPATAWRVS